LKSVHLHRKTSTSDLKIQQDKAGFSGMDDHLYLERSLDMLICCYINSKTIDLTATAQTGLQALLLHCIIWTLHP